MREPAARIVVEALAAGAATMRDVAGQTGLRVPTVKDALRRLRADGVVTTSGPHTPPVYELAAPAAY